MMMHVLVKKMLHSSLYLSLDVVLCYYHVVLSRPLDVLASVVETVRFLAQIYAIDVDDIDHTKKIDDCLVALLVVDGHPMLAHRSVG